MRKDFYAAIPVWILVLLTIPVLLVPLTVQGAGGTCNAEFTDEITDSPVEGENGKYETLEISINVDVISRGDYHLYGDLLGSGVQAVWYSETLDLDVGMHTLKLNFMGGDIYSSEVDGPYVVQIQLFGKNFLRTTTYTTAAYTYTQFEPSVSSDKPVLEWIGGAVVMTTDVAVFTIYTAHPTMEVWYSTDPDGSRSGLKVSFDEISGFIDTDGDGVLGTSDVRMFSADLRNVAWSFDMRVQESYDISFQAVVTLYDNAHDVYGSLRLGIYVKSDDLDMTSSDLGISVEISLLQPLGVDHIALQRSVTDLSREHTLDINNLNNSLGVSDNIWDYNSGVRALKDNREHGRYFYRLYPEVNLDTGKSETRKVLSDFEGSRGPEGGETVEISTCYPVDTHTLDLVHEQTIGVEPANKLPPPGNTSQNNPLLYVTGIFLAGGVVAVSIYLRKRGSGPSSIPVAKRKRSDGSAPTFDEEEALRRIEKRLMRTGHGKAPSPPDGTGGSHRGSGKGGGG